MYFLIKQQSLHYRRVIAANFLGFAGTHDRPIVVGSPELMVRVCRQRTHCYIVTASSTTTGSTASNNVATDSGALSLTMPKKLNEFKTLQVKI